MWAQNQNYKLYSHGKFIETKDRNEETDIPPGAGSKDAEAARQKLQAAIDSMPKSNPRMSQEENDGQGKGGRKSRKKGKGEGE